MNLADTIALYGGGPGSGCHGENCGRPAGHSGPHGPASGANNKMGDRVVINLPGNRHDGQQGKIVKGFHQPQTPGTFTVQFPNKSSAIFSQENFENKDAAIREKNEKIEKGPNQNYLDDPRSIARQQEDRIKEGKEAAPFKSVKKELKLPQGREDPRDGSYSWVKRGGYAGEKTVNKVRDAARAAGYTKVASGTHVGQGGEGVVANNDSYVKDGWMVSFSQDYGVTKSGNYFSINMKRTV